MTTRRSLLTRSPLLAFVGTGLMVAACSSDGSDGGGTSSIHAALLRADGRNVERFDQHREYVERDQQLRRRLFVGHGLEQRRHEQLQWELERQLQRQQQRRHGHAPPPVVPAFALALDNAAPSMNLADSKVVTVTITPQSWSGAVALTVTGLPSDVTAAFDNASVNVEGSVAGTAKLTLTSLSSTVAAATPFTITGTVGSVVKTSPATVTVKAWIDIHIPVNADAMTNGFGTVNIKAPADIANNPVTVNFINDDSTDHEIHAENGNQGFPHGLGTFGQGQADTPVRQVTQAGSYNWHLHDDAPPQGPPDGTVVIQ